MCSWVKWHCDSLCCCHFIPAISLSIAPFITLFLSISKPFSVSTVCRGAWVTIERHKGICTCFFLYAFFVVVRNIINLGVFCVRCVPSQNCKFIAIFKLWSHKYTQIIQKVNICNSFDFVQYAVCQIFTKEHKGFCLVRLKFLTFNCIWCARYYTSIKYQHIAYNVYTKFNGNSNDSYTYLEAEKALICIELRPCLYTYVCNFAQRYIFRRFLLKQGTTHTWLCILLVDFY